MFPNRSRISPLKLASLGAIAATALAAAPTALAATSGGAPVTPAAHAANSAPFTIGLSSTTVKPGAKLTISGLAYARAGLNVTILSRAISRAAPLAACRPSRRPRSSRASTRRRSGSPRRPSPACIRCSSVSATARSPRSATCASSLRARTTGGSTRLDRCAGIGFTVLHNDHADKAYLPGGAYTVSSPNMDCGTASAEFTSFLAAAGKPISGWTTTSPAAGRATFSQRSSGFSFTVAKAR